MLNREEHNLVYQHAYVPEHLPEYVQAMSGAEPYLHGDHLCFFQKTHLLFIGYSLSGKTGDTPGAYRSACKRFRPQTVAIIAPAIWLPARTYDETEPGDNYYRLDLPLAPLHPKLAYMVRRAGRELQVGQGTFSKEHQKLIDDFVSRHELSQEHISIFSRIPCYLKACRTALILEAKKRDALVAFNIMDIGSARYAFHLFNFRSSDPYIPGASDLLFHEMVQLAYAEGKVFFNLGLGIHPGVRRFKEKWGAIPFLRHASALVRRKPSVMATLLGKL